MEIKYNNGVEEKIVKIEDVNSWSYDTVPNDKIKLLNPELAEKIQKKVTNYIENKEKIDAENRLKAQKEELELRMVQYKNFKKQIESNEEIKEIIGDLELMFYEPKIDSYSYNPRRFSIKVKEQYTKATIEYDDRVYRSSSFHSSKTSRVWEVDFDYKRRRYTTVEGAVKGAVKQIEENLAIEKRKQEKENQENQIERIIQEWVEEKGWEFKKDRHYNRDRRGYTTGRYYDTFKMSKGNVVADLILEEEKVIITGYRYTKRVCFEELDNIIQAKEIEVMM